MRPRGRERGAEVVFRRQVVDRVVDQHGVERLAEADRAHVADVMGDAGIQAAGVREHGFGEVHRRGLEVAGEMVEEVAAAGAEFQEAPPAGAETGAEFAPQAGALVGVVLRRAHERPEVREVGVEAGAGGHRV